LNFQESVLFYQFFVEPFLFFIPFIVRGKLLLSGFSTGVEGVTGRRVLMK
jgi:hypothetical protein